MYMQSDIYKNIPISFDFITTWNQGVFLCSPCIISVMINDMIWYDMIWYDMIWYDMIWYDMIWYDMIWYDDIYLAAIGLTPGGSGTAHIYTQQYTEYKERNIHNNHKIEHA